MIPRGICADAPGWPGMTEEKSGSEPSSMARKIVLAKVAAGLRLTYSEASIAREMPSLLAEVDGRWTMTEAGERIAAQPPDVPHG